jgi:hypothetical protein
MSQSDYIQTKRIKNELKNITAQTLNGGQYTEYAKYSMIKYISNTRITYNVLPVEQTTTNCPTFPMCNNTQTRDTYISRFQPEVKPIRPIYTKSTDNKHCKCVV